MGALTTPLVMAIWTTFAEPAASPSVQWPLGAALGAAWLVTLLGPRRAASLWAWGVVLVLAALVLVFAVPDLELVAQAWTLNRAGALGTLFGMTGVVLLPLMEWLQRPNAWATPALMLVACATLIGLYLPAVQSSVDHRYRRRWCT